MTEDMLRLARAVYPDGSASVGDVYAMFDGEICVLLESVVRVRDSGRPGGWAYFDPANNADQAWDVLAWLLSKYEAVVNGDDVTVYIGNQQYAYTPHDGTASGIRAAVVEAARRVASR